MTQAIRRRYEGGGILPGGGTGLGHEGQRYSGEGIKGRGFFGPLRRPDGGYSTELSAASNLGGRDVEYPLIVPTLDAAELQLLLRGEEPTDAIHRKAIEHATQRMGAGRSPFAEPMELRHPLPEGFAEGGDVEDTTSLDAILKLAPQEPQPKPKPSVERRAIERRNQGPLISDEVHAQTLHEETDPAELERWQQAIERQRDPKLKAILQEGYDKTIAEAKRVAGPDIAGPGGKSHADLATGAKLLGLDQPESPKEEPKPAIEESPPYYDPATGIPVGDATKLMTALSKGTAPWKELGPSNLAAGAVATGKLSAAGSGLAFARQAEENVANQGENLDARDLQARAIQRRTPGRGFDEAITRVDLPPEDLKRVQDEAHQSGETAKKYAEQFKREVELVTPKDMSIVQQMVWSAVTSAPSTALGIGVGIATRNPWLGAAIAAGGGFEQQQGSTYLEAIEKGASHQTAFASSVRQGGIEMLDAVPVGQALTNVAMRKTILSFLTATAKNAGVEGATEAAQQMLQNMDEMASYNPNMTWGEFWESTVVAAGAGFFMGLAFGAAGHAQTPSGSELLAQAINEGVAQSGWTRSGEEVAKQLLRPENAQMRVAPVSREDAQAILDRARAAQPGFEATHRLGSGQPVMPWMEPDGLPATGTWRNERGEMIEAPSATPIQSPETNAEWEVGGVKYDVEVVGKGRKPNTARLADGQEVPVSQLNLEDDAKVALGMIPPPEETAGKGEKKKPAARSAEPSPAPAAQPETQGAAPMQAPGGGETEPPPPRGSRPTVAPALAPIPAEETKEQKAERVAAEKAEGDRLVAEAAEANEKMLQTEDLKRAAEWNLTPSIVYDENGRIVGTGGLMALPKGIGEGMFEGKYFRAKLRFKDGRVAEIIRETGPAEAFAKLREAIAIVKKGKPTEKQVAQRAKLSKAARDRRQVDYEKDSLIPVLIKRGGINKVLQKEMTGDTRANPSVPFVGFLFNNTSLIKTEDMLAELMEEDGFLTQADIDSPKDTGGTRLADEMVNDELRGTKHWSHFKQTAPEEEPEQPPEYDLAAGAEDLEGQPFSNEITPEDIDGVGLEATPANLAIADLMAKLPEEVAERISMKHANSTDAELLTALNKAYEDLYGQPDETEKTPAGGKRGAPTGGALEQPRRPKAPADEGAEGAETGSGGVRQGRGAAEVRFADANWDFKTTFPRPQEGSIYEADGESPEAIAEMHAEIAEEFKHWVAAANLAEMYLLGHEKGLSAPKREQIENMRQSASDQADAKAEEYTMAFGEKAATAFIGPLTIEGNKEGKRQYESGGNEDDLFAEIEEAAPLEEDEAPPTRVAVDKEGHRYLIVQFKDETDKRVWSYPVRKSEGLFAEDETGPGTLYQSKEKMLEDLGAKERPITGPEKAAYELWKSTLARDIDEHDRNRAKKPKKKTEADQRLEEHQRKVAFEKKEAQYRERFKVGDTVQFNSAIVDLAPESYGVPDHGQGRTAYVSGAFGRIERITPEKFYVKTFLYGQDKEVLTELDSRDFHEVTHYGKTHEGWTYDTWLKELEESKRRHEAIDADTKARSKPVKGAWIDQEVHKVGEKFGPGNKERARKLLWKLKELPFKNLRVTVKAEFSTFEPHIDISWTGQDGQKAKFGLHTAGPDETKQWYSTWGGGDGMAAQEARKKVEASREYTQFREAIKKSEGPAYTEPTAEEKKELRTKLDKAVAARAKEQFAEKGGIKDAPNPVNEKPVLAEPENTLVLMSCSEAKGKAGLLRELYDGPLWQTLRTKRGAIPWSNVLVLSGKHGLVGAEFKSEPYEQKLTKEKADATIVRGVPSKLIPDIHAPFENVIIVGSGDYRRVFNHLVAQLGDDGRIKDDAAIRATEGGIGYQRQQLGALLAEVNAEEKAPEGAKRAADFADTGDYEITINGKVHKFYRDPENKWWYEEGPGHFAERVLGFTKVEAIERLRKKYGAPVQAKGASAPATEAVAPPGTLFTSAEAPVERPEAKPRKPGEGGPQGTLFQKGAEYDAAFKPKVGDLVSYYAREWNSETKTFEIDRSKPREGVIKRVPAEGYSAYQVMHDGFIISFALPEEIGPYTAQASLRPNSTRRSERENPIQEARANARMALETAERKAKEAGFVNLANKIFAISRQLTGFVPPAWAKEHIANRIDKLIERARKNPDDTFGDIQPPLKGLTPRQKRDAEEQRAAAEKLARDRDKEEARRAEAAKQGNLVPAPEFKEGARIRVLRELKAQGFAGRVKAGTEGTIERKGKTENHWIVKLDDDRIVSVLELDVGLIGPRETPLVGGPLAALAAPTGTVAEPPKPTQGTLFQKTAVDYAAAKATGPEASEAQQEAGNYEKGHIEIGPEGKRIDLSFENEAGTKRRPEWPPLTAHYGYLKGTIGHDKDHLDAFVKPGTPPNWAGTVYVVNQTKEGDTFDEHKVMIGFHNLDEARNAYLSNYEAGWDRFSSVVPMPWPAFYEWAHDQTDEGPRGGELTEGAARRFERNAPPQRATSPVAVDMPGTSAKSFERMVVEVEKQRTITLPTGRIRNAQDAAIAFSQLATKAREEMHMLAVDAKGRPVGYYILSVGSLATAYVHAREAWTALYGTKGVSGVWISHNHPSGVPTPSDADRVITTMLKEMLTPAVGITYLGHIIIGGKLATEIDSPGLLDLNAAGATPRRVPVLERVVKYDDHARGAPLIVPGDVRAFLKQMKPEGPGVLLVDTQARPLGWWPMSIERMARGAMVQEWNEETANIIRLVGRTNPSAAFLYVPHDDPVRAVQVARAMKSMLSMADVNVRDAFTAYDKPSVAELGIPFGLGMGVGPYSSKVESPIAAIYYAVSVAHKAGKAAIAAAVDALDRRPGWQKDLEKLVRSYRARAEFSGIANPKILDAAQKLDNLQDSINERFEHISKLHEQWRATPSDVSTKANRARYDTARQLLIEARAERDAMMEEWNKVAAEYNRLLAARGSKVTPVFLYKDIGGSPEYKSMMEALDKLEAATKSSIENAHKAFSERIDAELKALDKREPPGPYSLDLAGQTGQPAEAVEEELAGNPLRRSMGDRVQVVGHARDLPQRAVAELVSMGAMGIARGYYDETTGKVWLVAGNIGRGEAEQTFLHESVGHAGLADWAMQRDGTAAQARLMSTLQEVYAARKADIAADPSLAPYGFDLSRLDHQVRAASEWIAHKAERGEEMALWQKVVAAIRAMLREMGFVRHYTDNDILHILQLSRSALVNSGGTTYNGLPLYQLGEKGPIWYSALEHQVNTKGMGRATPAHWANFIKNLQGVKKEEIEATGVLDWLALPSWKNEALTHSADGAGRISKDDVLRYLRDNGVELAEAQLGGPSKPREPLRPSSTTPLVERHEATRHDDLDVLTEEWGAWTTANGLPHESADDLLRSHEIRLTDEQRNYVRDFENRWDVAQGRGEVNVATLAGREPTDAEMRSMVAERDRIIVEFDAEGLEPDYNIGWHGAGPQYELKYEDGQPIPEGALLGLTLRSRTHAQDSGGYFTAPRVSPLLIRKLYNLDEVEREGGGEGEDVLPATGLNAPLRFALERLAELAPYTAQYAGVPTFADYTDTEQETAARHTGWTIPGGRNQVNLIIYAPQATPWPGEDDTHFGDVTGRRGIAWFRANERTDKQGRVGLFVEEIQAKRAEAGRAFGFDTPESHRADFKRWAIEEGHLSARWGTATNVEGQPRFDPERHRLGEEWVAEHYGRESDSYYGQWKRERGRPHNLIPTAPFVTNTEAWTALTFKRIVRYAVDHGYQWVAWTTGEQQNRRYALDTHVERIDYRKLSDGTYWINAVSRDGGGRTIERDKQTPEQLRALMPAEIVEKIVADKGERAQNQYGREQLVRRGEPTAVGHEAGHWYIYYGHAARMGTWLTREDAERDAERVREDIRGDEYKTLKAENLRVGGEAMREYYDSMLPKIANRVLKQLGATNKVQVYDLSTGPRYTVMKQTEHTASVVDRNSGNVTALFRTDVHPPAGSLGQGIGTAEEQAQRHADELNTDQVAQVGQQLGFEVTDALRGSAARGMPMFSLRADPPGLNRVYGVRDGRVLGAAVKAGTGRWNVYIAQDASVGLEGGYTRALVPSLNVVERVFARYGLELRREGATRNIPIPEPTLFDRGWRAPRVTSVTGDTMGKRAKNWLDQAVINLQNRLLLPRKYEETITREVGPIPEEAQAHREARLAHPRAAGMIADFEHDYVDDIANARGTGLMNKWKLSLKDVGLYRYALHAPERNAYVETINPENKAGSGLYTNRAEMEADRANWPQGTEPRDAESVMAELRARLSPEQMTAMEQVSTIIDRINHFREERLIDKGLVKREFVELLRQRYRHYAPLKEMAEDDELLGGEIGSGYKVRKPLTAAVGRFSEADAEMILPALIAQVKGTIAAGENAEVLRALLRQVEFAPNREVWNITKSVWRPRIDPASGMVEWAPKRPNKDVAINVPVDGDWYTIVVNDPALARAFIESGQTLPESMAWIGAITRFYATMATAVNPEFVVTNMLRDVQEAAIRMGDPRIAGQIAKDLAPAFWGAFSGLRAEGQFTPRTGQVLQRLFERGAVKPGAEEWHRWYRRYIEAGGHIAYRGIQDADAQHRDFLSKLASAGIFPASAGPLDWMRSRIRRATRLSGAEFMFEMVRDINGAVENATRLAVFKGAIERGMNDKEAAMLARNATVDFNLSGEWRWANQVFMFFNANAQGTALLFRSVLQSRGARAMSLLLLALGMFLEWWNRFTSDRDPDTGILYYDYVPEDLKQRNIVIMGPDRKNVIAIPLPFGFGIFHNIGRHTVAVAQGSEKPFDAGVRTFSAAANAMSPFGNVPQSLIGLVQVVSPTLTDPFVQHWTNRNWMERPIHPERSGEMQRNAPQAASSTYFSGTPQAYVSVAQWLNRVTGGNEVRSGGIDWYPNSIQHYTNTLFGSGGATYGRILNYLGVKLAKGEELEMREIPFLRRFYYQPKDYELSRRFYENVQAAEVAFREVRQAEMKGDRDGADILREEFQAERMMRGEAHAAERDIANYRSEVGRIKRHPSLDEGTRKEMLERIEAASRTRMQGFNRRFEEQTSSR